MVSKRGKQKNDSEKNHSTRISQGDLERHPSGHTREVIHPAGEGLGGHRKEYERRKTKTELLLLFFEMVYTLRRCKKFCG